METETDQFEDSDFVLSQELNEFSLEQCLHSTVLYEILKDFDLNTGSNSVKKMCEEFGVNDVSKFKQYENMAKNSNCYFVKLLQDYAVGETTVENKLNKHQLKNLEDLQRKLWNLKSGKLACKSIKKKEIEISNECIMNKNGNSKELFVLSVSLIPPNRNVQVGRNQVKIMFKDPALKKSSSESSESSSVSIISENSSFDLNNNVSKSEMKPLKNSGVQKAKRKIDIDLYYHPSQDKKRIENFIEEVKLIKPNIKFNDISSKTISQLISHIESDVPMFLLFDKQIEGLIGDSSACKCPMPNCGCVAVVDFYQRLYAKYLIGSFEKYFLFIMDEWNQFKSGNKHFCYTWLLKNKMSQRKAHGKKVMVKPYYIPCVNKNINLSPNFEYFLENFNYPNYSFIEFESKDF